MSKQWRRLFGSRTIYRRIGLNGLNITTSMKVDHLGLEKQEQRWKKNTVPAAAVAIDEILQMSATMLHENAVRHTYGRASEPD